jgi:hypothetical protein
MTFFIWIIGLILFCVWDAAFGWKVIEFGGKNPPTFMVSLLWFVVVPLILIGIVVDFLTSIKNNRLNKLEEKKQLRIKMEQDMQVSLHEIDEDLEKKA